MADFDFKILTILRMFKYKNKKEKIKEDSCELYKLTNEYLEQCGASPEFLEKPAIIERVKRIIFSNLLLGENTKFSESGAIHEKGENYSQTLGVLKNGSILFIKEYNNQKRITSFDLMDDEMVCRFMEYSENGYLLNEKRVIIDECGFDKDSYDTFLDLERKYRETFNPIISSVNDMNIIAIEDHGNPSITSNFDSYFLGRKFDGKINNDIFDKNMIDTIEFGDMQESYTSYPVSLNAEDIISAYDVKRNFEYLRDRYPNVEQWFINRFGKDYMESIVELKDDSLVEESELDKILRASESEIYMHFQNEDLNVPKITSYIKALYENKKYFCVYIFLQKLTDEEIMKFIKDNSEMDTDFIAIVASFMNDDKTKLDVIDDMDSFSILNKIQIVETIKSEDEKVDFYEENMEAILEYDKNLLEMEEEAMQEGAEFENNEYISPKILDSLSKKENLYKFLKILHEYCPIKYEYIKDFSLDEINDIIEDDPEELAPEEYVAILKTKKLSDEDIVEFLNDNWDEGLELSKNDPEIDVGDEITYSLKVFALLSMEEDDEKINFLEGHKDDYGADEITEVLKDVEDSEKALDLAKEYNLPKHYYYDLVILCSDDDKFKCLQAEKEMTEEEVSIIISAIEDMPRAFSYVQNLKEFNAMQKVRILSRIETEFYEDPEVMKKIKLKFLEENKEEIIKNVEGPDDLDWFSSYISDYGLDADKEEVIEELREKLEEYEENEK